MTAQLAGVGAAIGLFLWVLFNVQHMRIVRRWAASFPRPRIPRDDQEQAVVIATLIAALLALGLVLQSRWAFGLTVIGAALGCVVESAVRVVPHLRAGEQRLAMNHIIMGLVLLAVLILAVMGWNRLPPLIPGA